MALSVPLSRFTPQVGGGSAFFVRPLGHVYGKHPNKFIAKMRMLDHLDCIAVPRPAQDSAFVAAFRIAAQQMDFIIRFASQPIFPFFSQPVFVGFGAGFDGVEIATLEIQAQWPNKAMERNAGWRWHIRFAVHVYLSGVAHLASLDRIKRYVWPTKNKTRVV